MWTDLLYATLCSIALLYAPGYQLFRALRFSSIVALCAAPLVSVCMYSALPVAYYDVGIPCGLVSVAVPVLLMCTAVYAVACVWNRVGTDDLDLFPQAPVRLWGRAFDFDAALLVAYVLVALVVCLCMFVANLPHPDVFYSRFDNQTHLNLVQSFLDSGKWSTLHTSTYLASNPNEIPSTSLEGGFYPAAWHVLVALVCTVANTSVAVGTNAAVIAVCITVVPMGLFLFVRALFPQDRLLVGLGAVVVSSAAAYPWVFVVKGPTWPDMLGCALLPAVFAVVVLMVEQQQVGKRAVTLGAFVICSFVGIALVHPNGVFTAYVFFVPYGLHVLWKATEGITRGRRIALALVCCVVAVAFWAFCYRVPQLQGVLSYRHTDGGGALRASAKLALLGFGVTNEQPVLALGLLVGVASCIRARRWWMLFAPTYFGICFVLSHTQIDVLKYWFAALWYMTGYRFASRTLLFCFPLIAWGVQSMVQWLMGVLTKRLPAQSRVTPRMIVSAVLVAACVVNYAPYTVYDRAMIFGTTDDKNINHSAYGRTSAHIQSIYADDVEHVYGAEEVAFVNEAMERIPHDALVINSPRDGSMWAYAINRLNAYYRKQSPSSETEESKLLRQHLCDLARDPDVQAAVRKTGARYVLLLDKGVSFEDGVWLDQFKKRFVKSWRGIESIDDDTPGFHVVLARGDQMRLYQIDV